MHLPFDSKSFRIPVALAIAVTLLVLAGCDTSKWKSKDPILKAIADNTGEGMDITNDTSFEWNNVIFTLDKTHSCTRTLLKPGEKLHIKYSEFKDVEGDPYPQGRVPGLYFIDADEGTGPS